MKMFDASTSPLRAPSGFDIAAGYIGGDTPHVWTRQEWNRFSVLYKLPIYVRSYDGTDPIADAFEALRQLYAIGCPRGKRIALDLETRINPAYVTRFHNVVHWAGFRLWIYGSADFVFKNPRCDGYWVADYAGIGPFMYKHKDVMATQYASGKYDSSLVRSYFPRRFWK